jgi:hypothetical protein
LTELKEALEKAQTKEASLQQKVADLQSELEGQKNRGKKHKIRKKL